jgi:hypothetical protein
MARHRQQHRTGPVQDHNPRTAADIKELTPTLTGFNNDELKDIPIVPTGVRLKQGAVYLDLHNPARIIEAHAETIAREENLYVPKAEIPRMIWNRLLTAVGLEPNLTDKPEQEDRAPERNDQPSEEMIDKASADSFPTSDPPSWTTGREKE